jgi:hypothetical protein
MWTARASLTSAGRHLRMIEVVVYLRGTGPHLR